MSMRLRGLLADRYSSRVENAYLREEEVVVLDDVECEMVFESAKVFMEHENEQHHYLPVFHLSGQIKEIRGKFPYNVTTLFFADEDLPYLMKDCVYYPKPEELAHMITTGKFYSKRFQIPEILDHNQYSFPARIRLTIVPPPNPAAYEMATFHDGLPSDPVNVDKDNLPIFYVGLIGTGISRKNDPLLDYYDIDLDESFPSYVLTAESSGYTDPPLMMYIPEPVVEEEEVPEDLSDYYVTDEDEMIRATDEQQMSAEAEQQTDVQADYAAPDMESMIVAKADRNIERRIEAKRQQTKQLSDSTAQREAPVVESEDLISYEPEEEPVQEAVEKPQVHMEHTLSDEIVDLEDEITADPEEEYLDDEMEMDEEEIAEDAVESVDVTADTDLYAPSEAHPEVPQDYKEVQVTKDAAEESESSTDDDRIEEDATNLADMPSEDVEDAEAQTKLDDAKTLERAKDAAVQIQTETSEEESIHREAPDAMQEIAKQYANGVDEELGISF